MPIALILNSPSTLFILFPWLAPLLAGSLLISTVCYWVLFKRARQHGWAAIIPVYRTYIYYKLVFGKGSKMWFLLIPVYNIVLAIKGRYRFAKVFGQGKWFGIGMIFLRPIFLLLLMFGEASYIGEAAPVTAPREKSQKKSRFSFTAKKFPAKEAPAAQPEAEEAPPVFSATCPSCGGKLRPNANFCRNCGARVSSLTAFHPAEKKSPSETFKHALVGQRTVLVRTVAALLAVTLIVTGFVSPGFVWQLGIPSEVQSPTYVRDESMIPELASFDEASLESILHPEIPQTKPKAIPVSGTKAFTLTPSDGFTISAQENALDRERKIQVKKVSNNAVLKKLADLNIPAAPLFAYDVNAGLGPQQTLPGVLEFQFDLKKHKVPEELWDKLTILRMAEDGTAMELPCQRDGSILRCESRRNSIFAVVAASLIIMGPTAAHSIKDQVTLENLDFGDGPEHNQHSFRVNGKYGTYIVNLTSEQCSRYASTEEGKQYAEKADALRKRISNLQKSAYNFKPLNAAIDELAELETTGITNAQWRRENMGNMNLTVLEESLLQADDYLYGHRGFRVPGYTVNIYLSDVSNPSAFAYTVKLEHQPKPFVLVYTKRADFDKEPGQLLLTLTHELFHVAQTEYNPLNEDKDLPFSEATAGLVEMEASEYYEKHHISSVSRSMALDPFDSGSLPYMQYSPFEPIQRYKEGDSDDETNYREHGYALSGLLAKIRDSLNRGDDFCKQLMERAAAPDSSGEWNPYLNIVLDTMGSDRAKSADSLTDLYDAYLLEHRDSMLKAISRNTSSSPYDLSADSNSPYTARIILSEDHPFRQLAMPAEPLSFRVRGLRINESDPERQYRLILLHGTDPYEEKPGDPADNQKLIISDKPTRILQSFDKPGYAIFEKNASDMFYVSESNSYTTDEKTHPNTYEVLLLLEPKSHEYDYHFLPESPEDGEGAQEKEREFVIELFDTSEHYGYTVNFYTKNKHGNTYTQVKHREEFDAAPGAAEFRFSVEELEKLLGVKDLEDIQFSLCRRMDPLPEDTKSPDASADGAAVRPSEPVYGPECSPVILHTELEELLGHYSGQTLFRQALVTRECYERYRQQNPEDPLTKQQCDALMTSSLTENQRMNINDFCIAATREELQQNTCRVQCRIVLTSDGEDGEKEETMQMLETKAYFDGKRLLLNGETSDGREKTFQIRVHNHRDGRQTLSSLEFPAFLRLDEGKGTVIEAFLMFSALVRKNP